MLSTGLHFASESTPNDISVLSKSCYVRSLTRDKAILANVGLRAVRRAQA